MTEKAVSKPHSGPQGRSRPETWPAKVRTTMEPHREIEVGPAEWDYLDALGVLRKEG